MLRGVRRMLGREARLMHQAMGLAEGAEAQLAHRQPCEAGDACPSGVSNMNGRSCEHGLLLL